MFMWLYPGATNCVDETAEDDRRRALDLHVSRDSQKDERHH